MSSPTADPYYRAALAYVHDQGFGFHATRCAPDILTLLEPVLASGGTVLELGCGSGHLTRHLVAGGHRVIASDASEAMLDLTREHVPGAVDVVRITLPDDPLPPADAVVSVGHALSYLDSEAAIHRALAAAAGALRTGGVLALDLCDLSYGEHGSDTARVGWAGDDWALVTAYSRPQPDRFVREMSAFVRTEDGTYRRDDERHDNVLIDTAPLPDMLAALGVEAEVRPSFGAQPLPEGLVAIVGRRTEAGSGVARD